MITQHPIRNVVVSDDNGRFYRVAFMRERVLIVALKPNTQNGRERALKPDGARAKHIINLARARS